ncbi:hypothetical protein KW516_19120 [Vibrio fluvialis]|uniref:hypothetical protein n=1 Tax=Vibrio fluvialis TaxID=676 RepID=UPI001C9C58C9|nr:hypothetical protein [Vibrio fluvialis]
MSKPFSFLEFFVRLTGKYENHTGWLGAFEFKNGVSVRKLDRNQAQILPTVGFHCVAIDDQGEPVFDVIPGKVPAPNEALEEVRARFVASRRVKSEPSQVKVQEEPEKADQTVADIQHEDESQEDESQEDEEPATEPAESGEYTREQLEAIADKRGLKGLREIGDKLSIKGKSIPELIERILKGQK